MSFNTPWPQVGHDQLQSFSPYFLESFNMARTLESPIGATIFTPQPQPPPPHVPQPPARSPHMSGAGDVSQFDQQAANRRCGVRTSVPLACVACRSRHLKCDAVSPNCTRCQADGRQCFYLKSRRGYKGPKRNGGPPKTPQMEASPTRTPEIGGADGVFKDGRSNNSGNHDLQTVDNPQFIPTSNANGHSPQRQTSHNTLTSSPGTSDKPLTPPDFSFNGSGTRTLSPSSSAHGNGTIENGMLSNKRARQEDNAHSRFPFVHQTSTKTPLAHLTSQDCDSPTTSAGLLELFFSLFHAAHPFVLPRAELLKQLRKRQLPHLIAVMQYIGSFYARSGHTESYRDLANYSLFNQEDRKDGFTVQAMLLFAIVIHASDDMERASHVLNKTIEMALEIGMNRKEFAIENGEGCPIMEESWRRTFWELFFVDGIFATLHHRQSFRMFHVQTDTPYPCEEKDYFVTGNIPEPIPYDDFEDDAWASEERVYSSFAYRIEAMRNVGRILTIGQRGVPEEAADVHEADTRLVNWGLHLPEAKRILVDKDGQVDEMLFQAHMVANSSMIYLHRPRSHLSIACDPSPTSCTPPRPFFPPTSGSAFHTAKTLSAAEDLCSLITLPTALIKHTPLFACAATLASVVHLSASAFLVSRTKAEIEGRRERVRLCLGSLKVYREVWPVAATILSIVKGIAREVFASKRVPMQMQQMQLAAPPSSTMNTHRAIGATREGDQQVGWQPGVVVSEEEIMRFIEAGVDGEDVGTLDELCGGALRNVPGMDADLTHVSVDGS